MGTRSGRNGAGSAAVAEPDFGAAPPVTYGRGDAIGWPLAVQYALGGYCREVRRPGECGAWCERAATIRALVTDGHGAAGGRVSSRAERGDNQRHQPLALNYGHIQSNTLNGPDAVQPSRSPNGLSRG